jgi:hypothetical protein
MRTLLSAIVLMLLLVPGRTMAGLEITAYEGLEKVENPILDIDGEPVNFASELRLISSDFPERLDSFESGIVYHFHGKREVEVGSSTWYNDWRNELAKVAGYGPTYIVYEGKKEKRYDETVWRRHSGPFYELIDFSDAEGVIGPKTCAKLYNDFVAFEKKAKNHQDEEFRKLYLDLKDAFRFAAGAGVVVFH